VVQAAVDRDRAVVLLVAASAAKGAPGEAFLAALIGYAERAGARLCVQVDHVDDLELIGRALELGAGAVMADGSRLPLQENIALVRAAVDIAAATGAAVEAELGRVEGEEDVAEVGGEGQLTDPGEARQFVAETGAACLAVSIGNAHGRYARPPTLDWSRLDEIRAKIEVPLALHGASGIPEASVRRAVESGIRKVNVNTELREAYLRATAEVIDSVKPTAAVAELHRVQRSEVAGVAAAKLDLCDPKEADVATSIGSSGRPASGIEPSSEPWETAGGQQ